MTGGLDADERVECAGWKIITSQMNGSGVKVVKLSSDQQKQFRRAVRKGTHTSFLVKYPQTQKDYAAVKGKIKLIRSGR